MWNTNFKATMFQAKYFYMYSVNQLKNSMCHYYYSLFLCLGQCKQKKKKKPPYFHKPGGGGVKIWTQKSMYVLKYWSLINKTVPI